MRPARERARGKLTAGLPSSLAEIDKLKTKILDMEQEIDILKETTAV